MTRFPRVHLMPGECKVSWEPVVFTTLLGSCVSACLHDQRLKIGGMNHFMLPDVPARDDSLGEKTRCMRYGLYAMERLINDLVHLGARRADLVCKVFGGANMTGSLSVQNIGQRNADFVLQFLRQDGIPVVAQDLNGTHSRRIQFNSATNAVRIERVPSADSQAIRLERSYLRSINQDPVAGDIVFF